MAVVALGSLFNAQIVINEVYGGGGNNGATYKQDFVELKNIGSTPITLSNATLQYASATGTFNQYHPLPTITLAAGQTFLIQEGQGNAGTVDLTPDFIAPIPTNFGTGTNTSPGFAMSGTNMKIALVSNDMQITGPTDSNVIDFVGTGTANQFEGSAAAPAMTNTLSAQRIGGDTNNNGVDFTTAAPTPTNSSASMSVADVALLQNVFVQNTIVNEEILFGIAADVKVYNMSSQVVKRASVSSTRNLYVADLEPGIYIVTGHVNGLPVSQRIMKK